jgi:V8-like Glu-specific endopeptidase
MMQPAFERRVNRLQSVLQTGNYEIPFEWSAGRKFPLKEQLQEQTVSFWEGVDKVPSTDRLRRDIEKMFAVIYEGKDPGTSWVPTWGSVEAVVLGDGSRPVFFFEDDKLTWRGNPNGPVVDGLRSSSGNIEEASLSVGRIETYDLTAPSWASAYYYGTGFLVAPDLLMTNRHVVEHMIDNPTAQSAPYRLTFECFVNFGAQLNGPDRRYRIEAVEWMAPHHIGNRGDFTKVDVALLRLGEGMDNGPIAAISPLRLMSRPPNKNEMAAVIGFPAAASVYTGTGVPPVGFEFESVLIKHFDKRFGFKRCASGLITSGVGVHPKDKAAKVVAYDMSTLGGNSGSPVIMLGGDGQGVSALHFFGAPRQANFGFVMDAMRTHLSPFHIQVT